MHLHSNQRVTYSIITKLYTEKLIVFSQSSGLIAKRGLLLGRQQTFGINSRTFDGVNCELFMFHPFNRYDMSLWQSLVFRGTAEKVSVWKPGQKKDW